MKKILLAAGLIVFTSVCSAQELFSYELPISQQVPREDLGLFGKCEVSSRIVDGIRYYLVSLSKDSGMHLYGGGRAEIAKHLGNALVYETEAATADGLEKLYSEFNLEAGSGKVISATLFSSINGRPFYRYACGNNVMN